MGDYDEAIAAAQRALAHIEDPNGIDCMPCTAAHLAWGHALQLTGTYAEAQRQLEAALTLAQAHDLPDLESAGWLHLSRVHLGQGRVVEALDAGQRALSLSQQTGHRQNEADSLTAIGTAHYVRKAHDAARAYFDQALAHLREMGDRHREARLQNNIGNCLAEMGDYTTATQYYTAALAVHRDTGRRRAEGIVLNNLAALAWSQGDLANAWELYEAALAIAREIQDREGEALVRSNTSLVALLDGQAERAAALATEVLPLTRALGDRYTEGQTLMRLGLALTALDHFAAAEGPLAEALAIHESLETPPLILEARAALAHHWLRRGDVARAQDYVETILAALAQDPEALHGADEPFRVHWTCVRVLQAAGDPRASQVLADAAAALDAQAARIQDPVLRASFLENLAVHRELWDTGGRRNV
ncbi:MAG: tetratricopeptide repeat protein [Anaerolineae bacterium]|nr:tetratricopeptide repeat protein [Anaerolineae bacterium]